MPVAASLLVFVSGLGGFDLIDLPSGSIGYFRGLDGMLQRIGVRACFPAQLPFARVTDRAEFLARQLSALTDDEIILIAHSMGGLDCRFLAQHLDPERRVRTVATIATPHRGTPLADWILEAPSFVPWLSRKLTRPALDDLTTQSCERFNRNVPDRPDVRYVSYAGVRPVEETPLIFRPWVRRIASIAGENDSQVPLSSAHWGTLRGVVRADHFELSGWSFARRDDGIKRPFDHLEFYKHVIQQITENPAIDSSMSGGATVMDPR